MKDLKLSVASSPHASSPVGTQSLMRDVLIALLPALCIAVYFFGPRALAVTLISVLSCEFFEWGYRRLLKKPGMNKDLSAAVTGVLLAFVLPVSIPYWVVVIGAFFAIVVVKQLFGGLGKNFLNPALAARAFLFSYPVLMTTWVLPGKWVGLGVNLPEQVLTATGVDAVTGATPLAAMHLGGMPRGVSLMDMFIGNIGGCLGEVSALMLLVGGAYLVIRGVIRLRTPVAFIGTVALLTLVFPQGNPPVQWMLYQVCGGGLLLGAIFMATDYVTSPTMPRAEIVFGVGCGALTVLIRYFGGYPEGVSYAILIMNVLVPLLDKYLPPARFGVTAEMRKAAKEKGRAEKLAAKGGDAS